MTTPKDEVKMTNRERAEKLYNKCHQMGSYRITWLNIIERALDEKDVEWKAQLEYLRQFISKVDRLPKDFDIKQALDAKDEEWQAKCEQLDALIGLDHADCFIKGQKEMRERAAKIPENGKFLHDDSPEAQWGKQVGELIRTLPIEGE